jgi:hypothetical protein
MLSNSLVYRLTDLHESQTEKCNKFCIGLALLRRLGKCLRVFCMMRAAGFLLGVSKRKMRARCKGPRDANGKSYPTWPFPPPIKFAFKVQAFFGASCPPRRVHDRSSTPTNPCTRYSCFPLASAMFLTLKRLLARQESHRSHR